MLRRVPSTPRKPRKVKSVDRKKATGPVKRKLVFDVDEDDSPVPSQSSSSAAAASGEQDPKRVKTPEFLPVTAYELDRLLQMNYDLHYLTNVPRTADNHPEPIKLRWPSSLPVLDVSTPRLNGVSAEKSRLFWEYVTGAVSQMSRVAQIYSVRDAILVSAAQAAMGISMMPEARRVASNPAFVYCVNTLRTSAERVQGGRLSLAEAQSVFADCTSKALGIGLVSVACV